MATDHKKEKKKKDLLGMPFGTAQARLKKSIMFDMANRLDLCWCYRCGNKIDNVDEFSVEHKDSWQYATDPVDAFFSLGNIGFSHYSCNCGAVHRPNKIFASREDQIKAKTKRQQVRRKAKRKKFASSAMVP